MQQSRARSHLSRRARARWGPRKEAGRKFLAGAPPGMTTLELLRNAMRLKIVSVGEAVLRQPARSLTAAEIRGAEIQQLIQHMRETVNDAPGVRSEERRVGKERRYL